MDDPVDGQMRLATELACALISANRLLDSSVGEIMKVCYSAVSEAAGPLGAYRAGFPTLEQLSAQPAVPVAESLREDYLACLECGSRFQSLKRHLAAVHKLTPESYRQKWQLPDHYPMAAPLHSKVRSKVAKTNGLGRKREQSGFATGVAS